MRRKGSWYDDAQVCLNGHRMTDSLSIGPERTSACCEGCGAATLENRVNCNKQIRGHYDVPGAVSFVPYSPPSFCFKCGSSFPWTLSAFEAVKALAEESDELSDAERASPNESLPDLVSDTPQTQVAIMRINRWLSRTGGKTSIAVKEILMRVATEAVKQQMGWN